MDRAFPAQSSDGKHSCLRAWSSQGDSWDDNVSVHLAVSTLEHQKFLALTRETHGLACTVETMTLAMNRLAGTGSLQISWNMGSDQKIEAGASHLFL